jgi:putative phosphoesterase
MIQLKIAFISDIHGNAVALDHVLADISGKGMDKIYVLGDLCYRGPEPKRSLDLVRSLNTEVIKGNADEWVVRGVGQGEVADKALEMMNLEREWTVSQLDQSDLDFLSQLPTNIHLTVEEHTIHLFHATPDSLFEVVGPEIDDEQLKIKLMSSHNAQLYIYGHIHKPFIRYINGKIVMNTGSVGLSFDGLAMASYAMVEIAEGSLNTSIQRVSYPIEQVIEQYHSVRYPNAETMVRILKNARVSMA